MVKRFLLIPLMIVLVSGLIFGGCAAPAPAPAPAAPGPGPTPSPVTGPAAPVPAPEKPIVELKVTSSGGPSFYLRVYLEDVLRIIEERAGDRIKISYYPEDSLFGVKEAFTMIRGGAADIAFTCAGWEEDRLGVVGWVQGIPGNFDVEKFAAHARDPGGFYEFVAPYFEKYNLKFFTWIGSPSGDVIGRKFLVTPEDYAGLLIRADVQHLALFEALGAKPVFIDPAETYESLQRGTIDAAMAGISTMVAYNWYEVAKTVTVCEFKVGSSQYIMNLDTWNSLPSDLQAIIEEAFAEAESRHYQKVTEVREKHIQDLRSFGCEVRVLTSQEKAPLLQLVEPIYEQAKEKYSDVWPEFEKIWSKLR